MKAPILSFLELEGQERPLPIKKVYKTKTGLAQNMGH